MKIFEVSQNDYLIYKRMFAMQIFSKKENRKFYLKAATYAVERELEKLLNKNS